MEVELLQNLKKNFHKSKLFQNKKLYINMVGQIWRLSYVWYWWL